jgi:predicted Zn-dependent protease
MPTGNKAAVLAIAIAAATIGLLAGCGPRADELFLQPLEADRQLGRQMADELAGQVGLVFDPALGAYVNTVGQRLTTGLADPQFDYTFVVLDQAEPNAFAAPGGFVFVSRGLLVLANNEAELAAILAHEISHVDRRHTARQLAKEQLPGLLSLPGYVIGEILHDDLGRLVNLPVNMVGGAVMASFSRSDEHEADHLGQALLAANGYNPEALGKILERIESQVSLMRSSTRRLSFFDTHPSTPHRVRDLAARAQRMEWVEQPAVVPNDDTFMMFIEGLIVGPNPGQGVFQDHTFFLPDADIAMQFPLEWSTLHTPQIGGATLPDDLGFIVVGEYGVVERPEHAAAMFSEALKSQISLEPSEAEATTINDHPAYRLSYRDGSGPREVLLTCIWVAHETGLLQLIALTPTGPDMTRAIQNVASSIRDMTLAEAGLITVTRLTTAVARAEEPLASFNARTGSAWSLEETATANGISETEPLRAGQRLKIAVTRPYAEPSSLDNITP